MSQPNLYPHLLETTLEKKWVFQGKMLQVRQDRVALSDGKEAYREYVVHPGASCIIPFVSPTRLIMVRQYRYSVGKIMLEFPAGKLSPNEAPQLTAERELEEETGYRAKRWTTLGHCHACIGYGDEVIHYYAAEDLAQHGARPDEDEWVDALEMSVAEVYRAVDRGEISDSKTITGLLLAERKGLMPSRVG